MAGKRHGVDESQGDAADTYLHPDYKRAVLPAANETGGVRETESPEVYEIDAHDIPRLVWFQKGEDAVEVPTFTIHQHEAVNPLRILKATFADQDRAPVQLDLFGLPEPLLFLLPLTVDRPGPQQGLPQLLLVDGF